MYGSKKFILILILILGIGTTGFFFGRLEKESAIRQFPQAEPDISALRRQLQQTADTTLSTEPLSEVIEWSVTSQTLEEAMRKIQSIADFFNAELLPIPTDTKEKRFFLTTSAAMRPFLLQSLRERHLPENAISASPKKTGSREFIEINLIVKDL